VIDYVKTIATVMENVLKEIVIVILIILELHVNSNDV
jgi:hypothetical protein